MTPEERMRAGIIPVWRMRQSLGLPVPPDPNPFPRFRLFRRSRPVPPRCTGDPYIYTNGVGCVTIPMEMR